MAATTINLIIQIIAGIIGGNAAGSGMKNLSLGAAGNTIAGALGGLGGGQLLELIIPALQGTAGGGPDLGSVIGQLVGSGAGGASLDRAYRCQQECDEQAGLRVPSPMAARGNSLLVMVGVCGSGPWPGAAGLTWPDR